MRSINYFLLPSAIASGSYSNPVKMQGVSNYAPSLMPTPATDTVSLKFRGKDSKAYPSYVQGGRYLALSTQERLANPLELSAYYRQQGWKGEEIVGYTLKENHRTPSTKVNKLLLANVERVIELRDQSLGTSKVAEILTKELSHPITGRNIADFTTLYLDSPVGVRLKPYRLKKNHRTPSTRETKLLLDNADRVIELFSQNLGTSKVAEILTKELSHPITAGHIAGFKTFYLELEPD